MAISVGSIIAAGAAVTGDVSAGFLVGCVLAKVKKQEVRLMGRAEIRLLGK